jgi:dimethylhistidine N-methyltransferase
MMSKRDPSKTRPLQLHNFEPETEIVREEVLEGLQKPAKYIASKLLYDENGSRLFDEITKLDEYYPTRTESAIMQSSIEEIVALIGKEALLIEYGSGSSEKTRILLDHLPELAAYIPIDISKEHLMKSVSEINRAYPDLHVLPVCADYTHPFKLPKTGNTVSHRLVYYPGSTIGNFHSKEAVDFLKQIAKVVGPGGSLLLGVDLKKDMKILHAAYDDREGVTAAFNLNLLVRLNRELNTDFQTNQFQHNAVYNKSKGRIEMHLVSLIDQTVHLNDTEIPFKAGETIWTESSYKYSVEEFEQLAERAGFKVQRVWTDPGQMFSVQYLTTFDPGEVD